MTFALIDVRSKLAAVLAPQADSDPDVTLSLVDSIEPPALMLGWGEPWIIPAESFCLGQARAVVTCVAARLAPGEGQATLESLVTYVLGRLATDPSNWSLETVTGPRVFPMAKTSYLAARINVLTFID
jgi:hypothetical protein